MVFEFGSPNSVNATAICTIKDGYHRIDENGVVV